MSNQLVTTVDNLLQETTAAFKAAIVDHQWALVPDAQLFAAKQQLCKNDYLMKIAAQNPVATQEAIVNAAILGVDLIAGRRQGWLLPRKVGDATQVVLQVGYKGVEAIHQRLGVIDRLVIRVKRKNDQFDWDGDDQTKPTHVADWFATAEQRGPIDGAFAITYYPDESIHVTVTPISEIFSKHRDVSDSWKKYQKDLADGKRPYPPPWVTYEEQMVLKTMAFIASKQWPANIRNDEVSSAVLSKLNEVESQDYQETFRGYSDEQKAAFDDFVATDNALGLYLFRLHVGDDTYSALYNSAPKGKKMVLKDACRRMEKIGAETLDIIKSDLDADRDQDAYQHIEDMPASVFALLSRAIPEHREILKKLEQSSVTNTPKTENNN